MFAQMGPLNSQKLKGQAVLLLILFLSSCVGEKQGKGSADCGEGKTFNSVSRSCQSIGSTSPSALLSSLVFDEDEQGTTFVLNYKDLDSDTATGCDVTPDTGGFELRAPEYDDAVTDAQEAETLARTAANNIINVGLQASALAEADDALLGVNASLAAENTSEMTAAILVVYTNVEDAAEIAISSGEAVAVANGQVALDAANELEELHADLLNRCSCSAGTCESVYVGDDDWYGTGGFSYTITDLDGTSDEQSVSVVVNSINDKPMPSIEHVTDTESTDGSGNTVSFTVNLARDVEDDLLSPLFEYEIKTLPSEGALTNCLGIGGASTTDRTCDYTPTDGDDNGTGTESSVTGFNGLDITAEAPGTWGDNITLTLTENPISRKGNLNGSGGEANVEIEVDGYNITAFVETGTEVVGGDTYSETTLQNLVDALNNDDYASEIIDAAVNGGAAAGDPVSTGSTTLAGGVDAFDEFTYTVDDGSDEGEIDGVVAIDITALNDPPRATTTSDTIVEDTVGTISLDFFDPEGDSLDTTYCVLSSFTDLIQYTTCSCAGSSCSVDIVGEFNFNGTGSFDYELRTTDLQTFASAQQVNVTVSSQNDAPLTHYFNVIDKDTGLTPSESATSATVTYTFDVPTAFDPEDTSLTYDVTSSPTQGTLANCMNSDSDLECEYTPDDGNINGEGGQGQLNEQNVSYTTDFDGLHANQVEVQLVDAPGITAGSEEVITKFNSGTGTVQVTVLIDGGVTTANDVVTAVNNADYASDIMTASTGLGGTVQNAVGFQDLGTSLAGTDGLDSFTYTATDPSGAVSFNGKATINVSATSDVPVICEASDFREEPKCGLGGCVDSQSPIGNITPSSVGVNFYDTSSGICYESTGTSSNSDWKIVNSAISDITINELETIEANGIYLEEGGPGEDAETMEIQNVDSSNTTLVPVNQIEFSWNGSTLAGPPPYSVGDGGASADSAEFIVTVDPASGQTGSSDISFDVHDGTDTTSVSFTVTVNGTSANHKGWQKLKALGPALSTLPSENLDIDTSEICSFSRYKCQDSSGEIVDCQGTSDPDGQITAMDTNVIFYDSSADQCYYSSAATDSNWNTFFTYCNVTSSEDESVCTGASCLEHSSGAPGTTPTEENHSLYNTADDTCYRSRDDSGTLVWETYRATGEVKIGWEDFVLSGGGSISGYQVFRRVPSGSFDYSRPINKDEVSSSANSYTDNASNSWEAPIPKTVYEYEVRPIIGGVETKTLGTDNTVRMFTPPENMAFIHRWMANKATCDLMNATVDRSDNYSCAYTGPANDGSDQFDIGEDLLVERFEAACDYSRSPICDTSYGDCVGDFDPNGSVSTTTGTDAVFYDRSTGTCYNTTDSGTTWTQVSTSLATNNHREPNNPPLVNIEQNSANNFCTGLTNIQDIVGYNSNLGLELPNRLRQLAFSHWDYDEFTDSEVNSQETGLALNSSPKCNSSSADGLSDNYTDSATVVSSNDYSMPGTDSSGIRSMTTDAEELDCESVFGVSSVIGNVAEWTQDRIDCRQSLGNDGLSQCLGVLTTSGLDTFNIETDDTFVAANSTSFVNYLINGQIGPCRDLDGDGFCDQELTSWTIDNESFNAGRWVIPMGLPMATDFPSLSDSPDDNAESSVVEIGPTSGITSSKLHNDSVAINTQHAFSESTGCGAMATGGSYLSGQGAGRWNFEFVPCTGGATRSYTQIGQVAFLDIGGGTVTNIIISDTGGALGCSVTGSDMTITIDTGFPHTWADVISEVNSAGGCNVEIEAYASGDTSQSATTTTGVLLTGVNESSTRADVGFRCVAPVDTSNYQ